MRREGSDSAGASVSQEPASWENAEHRYGSLLRQAHDRLLPSPERESASFARIEARLRAQRQSVAGGAAPSAALGAGWWRLRLSVGGVAGLVLGFSLAWMSSRSSPQMNGASLSARPTPVSKVVPASASSADSPVAASVAASVATTGDGAPPHPRHLLPGAAPVALDEGTTEIEGEAVVRVATASDVTAQASNGDVKVILENGRVALQVRHRQTGDRAFSVSAGAFDFRVLGTVFEVERAAGKEVGLRVQEGLVAVAREGRVVARVGAGQQWHESEPRVESEPQLGEPLGDLAVSRGLAHGPGPARARSRRTNGLSSSVASGGRIVASREVVSASSDSAAWPSEGPALTGQPSRRGPCLALETSGRVSEAVACYETLGRGPGMGAEAALYQAAVLRRDNLRDATGALASFREYQQRFPHGLLMVEVGLSVAELLPRLGRYTEALAETDRLFAQGAGRERRAELLMLRGRILFEGLKDNERAEASFAEAAAGVGNAAVEATYFRGLCQQKLGRAEDARASFGVYLAHGRSAAHLRDARLRLGFTAP